MHRAGIVDQADRERGMVRVRLPELDDLLSGWLQVVQQGAAGRRSNWLPERGEQVLCLLDERGDEGFVLGGLYISAAGPPGPEDQVVFDDGTSVKYDRGSRVLRVSCAGRVEVVVPPGFTVHQGAAGLLPVDGVVTRRCLCAYTGAPHPDASIVVLAAKGGV